ncbi:MAG: nucleotidyltransferase domain-containing protein [Candidatus Thiosymbion ectosymbiont of Robbea hypermnestra]|nr:nucleotidyltransferase domain-containing protein [Candidatus Thiosymbion ectosymbiont of Robbea hypermnestra]
MNTRDMLRILLSYYSDTQAVYLFGSYGTETEWPDSDVDLALLLPFQTAVAAKNLPFSPCRMALEQLLEREVDLINLRLVSTVFQNEILDSGRLIIVNNIEAVREFEMWVLSSYQKLNEERKEILAAFYHSKRAYGV